MDNRKITLALYVSASIALWFLSRSALYYVYLQFYQIRRIPGILYAREAIPFALGAICFIVLLKNARINLFMEEVVAEIRKVTWPGREEVVRSTIVVIGCIAVASAILGLFDVVWAKVVGLLLKG